MRSVSRLRHGRLVLRTSSTPGQAHGASGFLIGTGQMHDEQVYPEDAHLIAADFKMIMHKAAAHARSDVLRATPSTLRAK